MTEPQTSQPQPPPPEEDEAALVPALLTVYALYLLWRGANAGFRGSALQVIRALYLEATIGGALAGVAQRALGRQRAAAGRAGDEFWAHAATSTRRAVDVGIETLAEALLWTDRHTDGDPVTRDAGEVAPGVATVPTGEDPPTLLARMLVTAVGNAAMLAAAESAGWRRKTWQTRLDGRVRDTHQLLHGRTVALMDPFAAAGHKLRFPGDPAAPISERANCRCWLTFTR